MVLFGPSLITGMQRLRLLAPPKIRIERVRYFNVIYIPWLWSGCHFEYQAYISALWADLTGRPTSSSLLSVDSNSAEIALV